MKQMTFKRLSKVEVFIKMARDIAQLSTCLRRQVGCILTDQHSRIIGSGYNGIPTKIEHICLKTQKCKRQNLKSGESLEKCMAIHAEANALMHCHDVKKIEGVFLYGPHPCSECAKLIANSSAKIVYFTDWYSKEHLEFTSNLFQTKNIELVKVDFTPTLEESISSISISLNNIYDTKNL